VTFEVSQGHWQWCQSIGHIRFAIIVSIAAGDYVSLLHRSRDNITCFPKFKEVT